MSTPHTVTPSQPAYLLRTPRLLLRCLEPTDAARRKDAVDSSGEHLKRFFPPTEEGSMSLDLHAGQLRKARANFDLDLDRCYGAFEPDAGRMLGETCLFKRAGLQALEIGYWLRRDAVGQGLATEMSAAMVKAAFELDAVKRMDLFCDPDNERSVAMARRLGFTLEGRLRDRQRAPHHERGDLLSFSLLASEYPRSHASQLPLEAFDFLGRRMAPAGRLRDAPAGI